MSFTIGKEVNPSKIFVEHKSNLTSRWDAFYFQPDLVALEKRVRTVTTRSLRDFVINMAGGATPKRNEEDQHYTTNEDGIPFLRVQNITEFGLSLADVKYVKKNVHEGLLRRSRVFENDLLITITGRIATAAVAPNGFKGNINQHSVVIKTASKQVSETLAAYLNLSFVGRLAMRRATGGTRPALDYPALLSIPVVFDERIPELMKAAVRQHQDQVKTGQALLRGIDDVLLEELGIPRKPEPPDTLKSRIFRRAFSQITGERFDAHFHRPRFEELSADLCRVPHSTMRELVCFSSEQWDQKTLFEGAFPYVEIGSVDLTLGRLSELPLVPIAEAANRAKMLVRPGDLLVSLTRPTRRAICFVPETVALAVASNGFCVIRGFQKMDLNSRYLFHVLRSRLCTAQFDQRSSGGNYPAVTEEQLAKLIIPVPKPEKQARIAKLLDAQYKKAEKLFNQARADLEKAKRDIEALIVGKEASE